MIVALSVVIFYAAVAMWQVWQWMKLARDENYSNPDDFPMQYASRVWLAPVIFTPMLWPAYVNSFRLAHYDQYLINHPAETKESAALASGFSNYMACYRAQQKFEREESTTTKV